MKNRVAYFGVFTALALIFSYVESLIPIQLGIPVVKLGLLAFLYQLVSAVLEPVCDRRITSCVSEAAEGYRLLLKLVVSALALFVVALAMICGATNVTYYAG